MLDSHLSTGSVVSATASFKYLVFELNQLYFGLPISEVREIIGFTPITPLPAMVSPFEGIIKLRGDVVPVMNLRARLAMCESGPVAAPKCIVIIQGNGRPAGLLVDQVCEVKAIPSNEVAPPPPNFGFESTLLSGVAGQTDDILILLSTKALVDLPARVQIGGESTWSAD